MAKRTKYVKPEQREILTAEVLSSKQISPNFVRVTIGGPGLAGFTAMGYDQWFRLFLPGRHGLRLPTAASNLWYAQYLMMGKEHRPVVRNYTVRAWRPAGEGEFGESGELDIDFAMHGTDTPACGWASGVSPGAEVGLLDEGIMYQAPEHTSYSLLVGDESALPAIAGVLRSAPRDLRGAAYIEITHPDDAQKLDEPDGVQVNWLLRTDPTAAIGSVAQEAVRTAELPAQGVYGFVAGEQKLASGVRRHLVDERGIPKADVTFTGYWRVGRSAG
ncbi:siderophore-interacting protein [Nocardia sp. CDC159]|uniref:Siderophore-interacting protein n=1 Tax=Nocardia pulmonis TaxID=2951408 RepID=A0A9X2E873_9NOCA|nr:MULTISPECIES: siderophore-interacting protein [Nocardia]MCM6774918.1 siderophore-interacting protein [Nocardia pulmonis]MCM6789849.1 siderophore-interacting protein [Nocardia sp. CDC159]